VKFLKIPYFFKELNSNQELRIKNHQFFAIDLKYFRKQVRSGSVANFFLGWADHPAADGTGHLFTEITFNVENLSTFCGAPK
jgi:hypothetical protein